MIDSKKIEQFAEKFSQSLPPGAKAFRQDIESNFKQALQSLIGKMDLVTREEFDVQKKVLARTRAKIEALEQKLTDFENNPS